MLNPFNRFVFFKGLAWHPLRGSLFEPRGEMEGLTPFGFALWPLQDERHDEILFKVFSGNTSCIIGAKKNKSKLFPPFSLVIPNWNHIEVRVDNFKTAKKTALPIKVWVGKAAHYQGLKSFCVTGLSSPLFLSSLISHFSTQAKCLHLNQMWVDSNIC